MDTPVYDNEYYLVMLDSDPYVSDGEPMNWLIINKLHNTIEGSVGPLPNAILLADQFSIVLKKQLKKDEDVEASTLN